MRNRHLFIIDPMEKLNLKLDSSLRLAEALKVEGHKVWLCLPEDLSWQNAMSPRASCQEIVKIETAAQQLELAPPSSQHLDDFATIHMRHEPPYDLDYVACTWILSEAARLGANVINSPEALRSFNEKLIVFSYPDDTMPGLLSSQPSEIKDFIENNCNGEAVVKPLYLYGGRGIYRIRSEDPDFTDKITNSTQGSQSPVLVHKFLDEIFQGEIRVFCAFGKPVAWCLKVPEKGNFLANTRSGAELKPYTPTPGMVARIERVSADLCRKGIVFTGYDIIGDRISEINITSPRMLTIGIDEKQAYRTIAQAIISHYRL